MINCLFWADKIMPTGIYHRTKEHLKNLKFIRKGEIPKHIEEKVKLKLKKVERFKQGLEIICKKHGSHKKWRLHTGNNVQCLFCASEWQINQRRRNPLKFIYRDAKKHAEKHKREFNIKLEDLENIILKQEGKCVLTGIFFDLNNPPSLDRIDSSIGYILSNIQFILIKINRMKSDLNQEEFIEMCKNVVNYSVKRKAQSKGRKK